MGRLRSEGRGPQAHGRETFWTGVCPTATVPSPGRAWRREAGWGAPSGDSSSRECARPGREGVLRPPSPAPGAELPAVRWGPALGVAGSPGIRTQARQFLSGASLREGEGEGLGRGLVTGKGGPRGDAIWAPVGRGQRPRLREPGQGHPTWRTFPGPERGARNSSPGRGQRRSVPARLPRPGLPKVTETRALGRQAAGPPPRARARQSPAADPCPSAPRPREGALGCRPWGPRQGRAPGGPMGGAAPGSPRPSPRAPPLPPALGPPGEPGRAAWALRGR